MPNIIGDGILGTFKQPWVGAESRTANSKAADIMSIKDFGGVSDGVTDNTPALLAAVNVAKTNFPESFKLHFPAGRYKFASTVDIIDVHDLTLSGEGYNATTIIGPSNQDIFRFTKSPASYSANITVENMFFLNTSVTTGGVAIKFEGNSFADPFDTIKILNVRFDNIYQSIFCKDVQTIRVSGVRQYHHSNLATVAVPIFHFIRSVHITMDNLVQSYANAVNGIEAIICIDSGCDTVELLNNGCAGFCNAGVHIRNNFPGIVDTGPRIVRVTDGTCEWSTVANIIIDDCLDTRIEGYHAVGGGRGYLFRGGKSITLQNSIASLHDVCGIEIDGSTTALRGVSIRNCTVANNTFDGIITGPAYPSDGLSITDCRIGNLDIWGDSKNQNSAIVLNASAHDTIIANCNLLDNPLGIINNSVSTSILMAGNIPNTGFGVIVFPDGDSTPSISASSGVNYFRTANSAPTTITDFDDGVLGQIITVQIDINTTLQAGSGLILSHGSLVTGNALTIISFVYDGAIWDEVSRNGYELLGPLYAPDGDTTPSVANAWSRTFVFNNSATTIVTDFDDGYDLQELVVKMDSNTSLINSPTTIVMQDGQDLYGANGAPFIGLRFFDGAWREEWRSHSNKQDTRFFTPDDTTPSVGGINNVGHYIIANTVPTVITNFDDGYDFQQIQVRCDVNTGFEHGVNIFLADSMNIAPGSLDARKFFVFRRMTGNWVEVSRTGLVNLEVDFADGDATPSVAVRVDGGTYNTNNTVATNITNFDDGQETQVILVRLDANTTLVHDNTKIKLKGAVNVTGATSDNFISFKRNVGIWYEQFRNF